MRRHGKLTLLQLAIRSGKVWLIDVSTLGDRAFTTAAGSDAKTTLKSILQSRSARKVSTIRTTGSPCQRNAFRRIVQSATSTFSFVVIHSHCTWQHARLDQLNKTLQLQLSSHSPATTHCVALAQIGFDVRQDSDALYHQFEVHTACTGRTHHSACAR